MVTRGPNEPVAPIHSKAMITILEPAAFDRWPRGSCEDIVALQQPDKAAQMVVRGPVFPTRSRVAQESAKPSYLSASRHAVSAPRTTRKPRSILLRLIYGQAGDTARWTIGLANERAIAGNGSFAIPPPLQWKVYTRGIELIVLNS